jgi:hypothetical protein
MSARALRVAGLEPENIVSMRRRARVASVLPKLQARVGQGTYDYTRNPDSLDASVVSTQGWRFDISATFSLDHLVFNPYEPRVAEAAGRLLEHRIRLLDHVASTWAARRALDEGTPLDAISMAAARDRCEQLTVLISALTGLKRPFSLPRAPPQR